MIELWHLNDIDWLKELPAEGMRELRAAASALTVDAGSLIFEPAAEPDSVFILESGLVRMMRVSANGEEVTFGYVRPGEVFGELAAFSEKPRESYAIAMQLSTVLKIERRAFAVAIKTCGPIVFSIAAQIEDRFKEIESRVEDLVFRSARSRVARIILQLSDEFGRKSGDHSLIDIRLTHAELATLAGTSRPTVSIALGELEDEGLIARNNGKIALLDEIALREDANALA